MPPNCSSAVTETPLTSRRHKTVLVTGGNGKLGAPLCRALVERYDHVIAVDRHQPDCELEAITFHQADLLDFERIFPIFAHVDVVIHTAALHGYHLQYYASDTFFTNNVNCLFNVLQACIQNQVPKIVFTSSTAVYGVAGDPTGGKATWINEALPRRWRDIYGATKMIGEDMCEHHAHKYGVDVTALRCTRYTDDHITDHIRKLSQGVDLRDAVQAHCLAAEKIPAGKYQAYNIGPELPFRQTDVEDLYTNAQATIEQYFPGVSELFARKGVDLPERIERVYDISKAKQELNYQPQHTFADFLHKMQQDMQNQTSDLDTRAQGTG